MLKKLSLFAIALLLLIQLTTCLPTPSSSESEEDNTIPHGASRTTSAVVESAVSSERQRLDASVFKNFENFLDYRLQRTNKIAQDVLADPAMNSIKSQAMEDEKNELRKYMKDSKEALIAVLPADKINRHNRFFFVLGKDFVLENFNNFEKRRHSDTQILTPEKQVSRNALRKHGLLEYIEEQEKRANEFACQIVDDFDDYMKALPAAEKEKQKDMVEAWNMYKSNKIGLSKVEFGQKLFGILFQYDAKPLS